MTGRHLPCLFTAQSRDTSQLLPSGLGRFPRGRSELHDDAVEFVARQLGAGAGPAGFCEWSGRTVTSFRSSAFPFRLEGKHNVKP